MTEVTIHYDGPIVSREEALTKGLLKYFPNTPCKYGHIDQKYTKTYICEECQKRRDSRKTKGLVRHDRLLSLLNYDKRTGLFRWRVKRSGNVSVGDIAGNLSHGYWVVKIDSKRYLAHVLAFFYVTGEWPTLFVDHRNCTKHDNSWDNLRLATKHQNGYNRPAMSNNTSGAKGVHWHKTNRKWCATIRYNGTQRLIGFFDDKNEAAHAYAEAAKRLHGEFANTDIIS